MEWWRGDSMAGCFGPATIRRAEISNRTASIGGQTCGAGRVDDARVEKVTRRIVAVIKPAAEIPLAQGSMRQTPAWTGSWDLGKLWPAQHILRGCSAAWFDDCQSRRDTAQSGSGPGPRAGDLQKLTGTGTRIFTRQELPHTEPLLYDPPLGRNHLRIGALIPFVVGIRPSCTRSCPPRSAGNCRNSRP